MEQPSPPLAISVSDVRSAANRIGPHTLRTPAVFSEQLSQQYRCKLWFKAENLQHIGAFKARGAMNGVLMLDDTTARRGVVTHSSGNHAAALARAASIRGIPAFVVMPKNSASNKIQAVRSFGVEPVLCEPTAESRESTAADMQQETGATLIHPYDHPSVMAGQGTVGLELLEQIQGLDAVIVPVGGGGLLSGVLTAIKAVQPRIRVIAAEPMLADDAARSLSSGQIEMPTRYDTIADGLRTPLGRYTFPIIQALLDDIVLVSEQAIDEATWELMERGHLIAEPSGAVALAALASHAIHFENKSVAVVVSGGNLELDSWFANPS